MSIFELDDNFNQILLEHEYIIPGVIQDSSGNLSLSPIWQVYGCENKNIFWTSGSEWGNISSLPVPIQANVMGRTRGLLSSMIFNGPSLVYSSPMWGDLYMDALYGDMQQTGDPNAGYRLLLPIGSDSPIKSIDQVYSAESSLRISRMFTVGDSTAHLNGFGLQPAARNGFLFNTPTPTVRVFKLAQVPSFTDIEIKGKNGAVFTTGVSSEYPLGVGVYLMSSRTAFETGSAVQNMIQDMTDNRTPANI